MYADDVIVISEEKSELQQMLNIVDNYAKDFEMKFSPEKSESL